MKDNELLIAAANIKERMENPSCPIAGLLDELLEIGDESALELATQIAKESLSPRQGNCLTNIISRLIGR